MSYTHADVLYLRSMMSTLLKAQISATSCASVASPLIFLGAFQRFVCLGIATIYVLASGSVHQSPTIAHVIKRAAANHAAARRGLPLSGFLSYKHATVLWCASS